MALSGSQKQAALRARRAESGLVHFQAWVTTEQREFIRRYLRDGIPPGIPPVPVFAAKSPAKARRKKRDPVREGNDEIVAAHALELAERAKAGQKATALAEWLRQFGFVGNGATLNGIWKP